MKSRTKKPSAAILILIVTGFLAINMPANAISIFVSPLTYNMTQTDTNKIQFDIYVKNTGLDILGYRAHTLRFTMNRATLPAGTITGGSITYLSGTGDVRLSGLQASYNGASTVTSSASVFQVNMGSSTAVFTELSAPIVNPGDSIWLGTFLITSPVGWICNTPTTPVWLAGTPCSILVYDAPPSTTQTAICNSVNSGVATVSSGNLQTGVVTTVNPAGLGRAPTSILLTCGPTHVADITKTVYDELVYPNPTSGKLNIVFRAKRQVNHTLIVIDLLGNRLMSENFSSKEGTNFLEMDLSALARGIYFLRFEGEGTGIEAKRIVVE